MTEILLINPEWRNREEHIYSKVGAVMPALGLAQIAAVLEKVDAQVKILDAAAENFTLEEIGARVKKENPEIVGITSTTSTINRALETAKLCKSITNAEVWMGGVHVSIFPQEILSKDYIDYISIGEAELTIVELYETRKRGGDVSKIKGLGWKKGKKACINPVRPNIENLDELPMPAYHLLPMKKYRPAAGTYRRLPAAPIITSRGCPGRCTFCYKGLGYRVRRRSPEKVLSDIRLLMDDFRIREIIIYDDTFTVGKKQVIELCDLIKKEKLDITWSCMGRVDFVDYDELKAMHEAGCHSIGYGVESGDQEILANLKKGTDLDQSRKAILNSKKAGLETRAFFMLGNPGETEESIEKTIRFAIELDPDIALFNITTPFPGTEMFRWADEHGHLITKDWSRYDCSEPLMNLPTISPEEIKFYYKQAFKRFYLRPSYIVKRLLKLRSLTDIEMAVNSLIGVLRH